LGSHSRAGKTESVIDKLVIGAKRAGLFRRGTRARKALLTTLVKEVVLAETGLVAECQRAGNTRIIEEIVGGALRALALGRRPRALQASKTYLAKQVIIHFHTGLTGTRILIVRTLLARGGKLVSRTIPALLN
jgi:hypothetical protein